MTKEGFVSSLNCIPGIPNACVGVVLKLRGGGAGASKKAFPGEIAWERLIAIAFIEELAFSVGTKYEITFIREDGSILKTFEDWKYWDDFFTNVKKTAVEVSVFLKSTL